MRSWLALVLHAAAVAGAIANHEEAAGPSAHRLGSSGRRLTQSLLEYFFTMSQPRVDRCWAVTAVDDAATGEERPAINCDFTVPKKFNSTAGIRMGPCADLDEPICAEKVNGECTSLMVVASGRVRTTAFLKLPPREVASETNHTYCARADVYQDLDGSGEQTSVEHAEREIIVAFTGGDTDNYVTEETDKKNGGAIAAIAGSVVGILILVPVVAFFSTKGRRGGTKIHDTTEGKPDDETAEEDDDDTIEIV